MKTMTKEQAIAKYGEEFIARLDAEQCEPTSRLIYPAFEAEHAGMSEFSAGLETEEGVYVAAYYYQPEDLDENDYGLVDWVVDHYEDHD